MTLPHTQFLRAAALVGCVSRDGEERFHAICNEHYVAAPGTDWATLTTSLVASHLPPALEAAFLTTDVTTDQRPFFLAAEALGLSSYMAMFATGPTVHLPDEIRRWRTTKSLRVALEVYQLAGVNTATVAADLQKMYGRAFDPQMLELHATLFADRTWLSVTGGWEAYEACVGAEEAAFKRELMAQPEDYLRWKMGVPVTLDSDRVLDRMISDAYYTERLLKSSGTELSKDDIARIKLERDTIFKAMDRKLKMKVLAESSGDSAGTSAVVAAIERIALAHTATDLPMLSDLADG
jgi:hypothetical protein